MSDGITLAGALAAAEAASAELAAIRAANEGLGDYTGELDEPDAEMAELDALLTLADAVREQAVSWPPGTPVHTGPRETYPTVVLTPPATVAGNRVLAWAESRRRHGEYPGGVVLTVSDPRRRQSEYVVWNAYTQNGGRSWTGDRGDYSAEYAEAWDDFTRRAAERPGTEF